MTALGLRSEWRDEPWRQLSRIDWNFTDATTPDLSPHAIHWFPGNFIPQIPSFLIQALSQPGELVLDPFCGSGTVAIEAIKLGRRARQSDVCHASLQVANAKLIAAFRPKLASIVGEIQTGLVWDSLYRSDAFGMRGEGSAPELAHWFDPVVLEQLRYLWALVEKQDEDLRVLLEALFTDLLFAAASPGAAQTSTGRVRKHHWGWIADNVRPRRLERRNVVDLFRRRLVHLEKVLAMGKESDVGRVTLLEDARELSIPDDSVHLVVTSPPYFGMIDYTLANRLAYLWMGWDLAADREVEIGARRYRDGLVNLQKYVRAMEEASLQICRVLRRGGYCAIVIGASRKAPEMASDVCDLFGRHLEVVFGPQERTPTRRRVSQRSGQAPVELLCVFRKPE